MYWITPKLIMKLIELDFDEWYGSYTCEEMEEMLKIAKQMLMVGPEDGYTKIKIRRFIKELERVLRTDCELEKKCEEGDENACKKLLDYSID